MKLFKKLINIESTEPEQEVGEPHGFLERFDLLVNKAHLEGFVLYASSGNLYLNIELRFSNGEEIFQAIFRFLRPL